MFFSLAFKKNSWNSFLITNLKELWKTCKFIQMMRVYPTTHCKIPSKQKPKRNCPAEIYRGSQPVSYLFDNVLTHHSRDSANTIQNKLCTMAFFIFFEGTGDIIWKGRPDVVTKHTQRSTGNASVGDHQRHQVTWSTPNISHADALAKHFWRGDGSDSQKCSWTCL